MKNDVRTQAVDKNASRAEANSIYKKVTRFIEFYILFCFVLITVVPLYSDVSWVPGFSWFIYITGFPLLILLVLASFVKETIVDIIGRLIKPEQSANSASRGK